MGDGTQDEVSREEIKEIVCSIHPTNPDTLKWEPLLGVLLNTIRLRMNITEQNASIQLIDACRTYIYPEKDVPEVEGLLRVLRNACSRAKLGYRLTKGPRELQLGGVGFFEPYRIELPFKKARLYMTIAPGEFQWILKSARKEKSLLQGQLNVLKEELLRETREWLRRGNR